MDYEKLTFLRKRVNFSTHSTPAFCSPGAFPATRRIIVIIYWTSSKHMPCSVPRPAHPGGMRAKMARPPGDSIGGRTAHFLVGRAGFLHLQLHLRHVPRGLHR